MNTTLSEKHTTAQSIGLHLLPGVLIGGFYFLIRKPIQNLGYPSVFALMLAVALILVPVELGYLLYQGKKKTGRFTVNGIISYRNPMPWWQYILWVAAAFVAIGALFTILEPVQTLLQEKLFFWVPALDSGLDGSYSKTALVVTYAMILTFGALIGPLVEELYFRGYLLPRMPGRLAPLFHSLLFAAYHVFSPWMLITRTVGLLPLIYVVRKKNIYAGMLIHFLLNSLDVMTGFVFIAKMK